MSKLKLYFQDKDTWQWLRVKKFNSVGLYTRASVEYDLSKFYARGLRAFGNGPTPREIVQAVEEQKADKFHVDTIQFVSTTVHRTENNKLRIADGYIEVSVKTNLDENSVQHLTEDISIVLGGVKLFGIPNFHDSNILTESLAKGISLTQKDIKGAVESSEPSFLKTLASTLANKAKGAISRRASLPTEGSSSPDLVQTAMTLAKSNPQLLTSLLGSSSS